MRGPAYEPSPQVKPVVHAPFGIKQHDEQSDVVQQPGCLVKQVDGQQTP